MFALQKLPEEGMVVHGCLKLSLENQKHSNGKFKVGDTKLFYQYFCEFDTY